MRRLILAPDESAAGMVRRRREPGARLIGSGDDYTVGPLLSLDDLEAFSRARRAYWSALHAEMDSEGWLELVPLHDDPTLSARLAAADQVEIWCAGGARDLVFLTVARALLIRLGLDDARLPPPRPHAGLPFALAEEPQPIVPVPLDADLATDLARTWAVLTGAGSDSGWGPPADSALRHALDIVQSCPPVPPGGLDALEARVLSAVGETFTRASRPIADALVAG